MQHNINTKKWNQANQEQREKEERRKTSGAADEDEEREKGTHEVVETK